MSRPEIAIHKTNIINMEGCRWLPNETDQDHIIVNISEFTQEAFKKDSLIFQCNVAVGKERNKNDLQWGYEVCCF